MVAAKKVTARTTLLVPCTIKDNRTIKAKEKGKAKERGVVVAVEVTGEAGMVEVKAKEAKVKGAVLDLARERSLLPWYDL